MVKLYEAFQKGGYHTTMMTSFGVDFDAFESVVVRRLRSAECRNIVLVCDSGMLGLALADSARPPRSAGSSYLLTKRGAAGVFHPKLTIQIGADRGRLIVASANATAAGLAGNLELATVLECGADDSGERRLLLSGWKYAVRFLDRRQSAVDDKLRWAVERSPWLASGLEAAGAVTLSDGTLAAFVGSGEDSSIASRFVGLVGTARRVDRLTVVSPYWDGDLEAMRVLQEELRPRETVVAIDPTQALFPKDALKKLRGTRVVSIANLESHFDERNSRFAHAKLVMASVGDVDHVLVGSANCTTAALGSMPHPGPNEEACLYRRLPRDLLADTLGLKPLIEGDGNLAPEQLPEQKLQPELPLRETVANDPGVFELAYERLHWWPSSPTLAKAAEERKVGVELFDDRMRQIRMADASVRPIDDHFELALAGGTARPALARIRRQEGSATGMAVVASVGELRSQTRDPATARTERALRELQLGDDEGLWLLDVIQTLSPEGPRRARHQSVERAASSRRGEERSPAARRLDFETFMRGRRRDVASTETARNSLAGGHVSYVRAALNRLLGMAEDAEAEDAADLEPDVADALDRGDEVGDARHAVDEGFDPDDPKQSAKAAARSDRQRRAADAESISAAVDDFAEEMRDPEREIGPVDMLRLRAFLMILAVAGWPGGSGGSKPSANQVLPCWEPQGGPTWPREMGKVLAPFFLGTPAIRRLVIDKTHDRLPDDLLEDFACCIWAAQAALAATKPRAECKNLVPFLEKLNSSIRTLMPLSGSELESCPFADAIAKLDKRFGGRLRLPSLGGLFQTAGRGSVAPSA